MKIGLLGGTFDPPHMGHLNLAKAALETLGLDEVLFVPASRNPVKKGKKQSSGKDRLAMLRLLIQGVKEFGICDMELVRGGISYTIETVMDLSMVHPGDYWLLFGADILPSFPTWKSPEKIVKYCRLGVASRGVHSPAELLAETPERFRQYVDIIPMKQVPISSTELRDRVELGMTLSPWVPMPVQQYIKTNRLYR